MLSSAEQDVGLLLFIEPCAPMDSTAEHGTIPLQYLLHYMGTQTYSSTRSFLTTPGVTDIKMMIFSACRFGSLTRRANLILYVFVCSLLDVCASANVDS
jgi:hypothetical protein